MRTITITGGRQPPLFRQLLQSLVANDLEDWRIFIQVDQTPAAEEYHDTATLLGHFDYSLSINQQALGIRESSCRLLEYVFGCGSALNINLAEDVSAAPDVTHLAQWYGDHHRPEWLCLSLASLACPLGFGSGAAYADLLFPGKEFSASGFVVRRGEWYRHFRYRNSVNEKPDAGLDKALGRLDEDLLTGWDWSIRKHLLRTDNLVSLQPVAARVTRAGHESGGNRGTTDCNHALGPLVPPDRSVIDRSYQVVNPDELPATVRSQLPVQVTLCKLLGTLAQNEDQIKVQSDALAKQSDELAKQSDELARFRLETNERVHSLTFALARLLARLWCTVLPNGSRRYRIWHDYVRDNRVPPNSTIPSSAPNFSRVESRAIPFQGLPRLVSSKDTPVRILILKLDHIGDFLLSISAISLLREAWPGAHLTIVCGPWNAKLASQFALFDEIHSHSFFSPRSSEGISGGNKEFCELPLGEYDLAIDLRHDTDTRPTLNLVRARYRAGFACAPQFPVRLDLAVPNVEQISELEAPRNALHSETRLILLVSAIIATFGRDKHRFAHTLVASRPLIRYFDQGPVVGLALGAGSSTKQWGIERFSRVALALNKEAGCRFVLFGGESDKMDAALVAAELPSDQYADAVGQLEISEAPLALAAVDLFIGNDTGLTHMAALMGIPTVNIFSGAVDINVWHANGPNVITLYAPVPCAPCRLVNVQDCSHGHVCLTSIREDDVVASALSLLSRSGLQVARHEIGKVDPREEVTGDAGLTGRCDVRAATLGAAEW
jgi:ADP-heptose:LPS heptosyltransferase